MVEYRTIPRPLQNQPAPRRRHRKKKLILVAVLLAVVIVGALWLRGNDNPEPTASGPEAQLPAFDTKQFSTADPASPWVVVNKKNPLNPKEFTPSLTTPDIPLRFAKGGEEMQVSTAITPALEAMVAAAKDQGLNLMLASGYRSYNLQTTVYNNEVKAFGQAKADQESARPGHSEHQTGLAVDLEPTNRECEIQACFATTKEGQWLAAHAYEYGFILRYTVDKVAVTGYTYEPWHFRFVGSNLATELHRTGIKTLEEFFSLPGGTSY